jgi:hypothetical protein
MSFKAIPDDGGQISFLHLLQLVLRKIIVFCLLFCAPVKETVATLFFLQRWLLEGCSIKA